MPIIIKKSNPAFPILKAKNVFVMDTKRAETQEIRPLKIGILNLMPTKEKTATQLFRMIGNSPLQIEPILIKTASYESKNTSQSHLKQFYTTFSHIKKIGLDGLIITGAPVENLEFLEVQYWKEFTKIMDWAKENVCSTLFLCWAAQAGLYYHYGIKKYPLKKKKFGVFLHTHKHNCDFLLRGIDDYFYVPHSRHTKIRESEIEKISNLEILATTKNKEAYLIANKDRSAIFIIGHPEYDRETLALEYFRDKEKGLDIQMPYNYFPRNDDKQTPKLIWRANAEMFYNNWINFVYQTTHYDLQKCRMNGGNNY